MIDNIDLSVMTVDVSKIYELGHLESAAKIYYQLYNEPSPYGKIIELICSEFTNNEKLNGIYNVVNKEK